MQARPPLPPGPRGLPLLGDTLTVARRGIVPVMLACWREFGDVFQLRLGGRRIVVLAHPDAVERVLVSGRANYYKGAIYDPLRVLIGEGLATVEGERWQQRRRKLQPAFRPRGLDSLTDTMLRLTGETVARWRARVRDGERVAISDEMARLTFRIIGATLFGIDVEDSAARSVQAFSVALDLLARQADGTPKAPLWLPTPGNRRLRAALRTIDAEIAAVIAHARRSGAAADSVLARLLAMQDEVGVALTDRELRDEIVTMFLAGHETVALTVTWALERLSREPAVAARVAAEADAILGDAPDADGVARLRYTRMVVDEVLRVRCPAYIVARNCRDDDVIGGFTIPAGSVVLCAQHLTHRHPDFWPDPEQLRPERFDPDAPQLRHEYAYYPFSKGPRICIGNNFALTEVQAILATIVRAAEFAPTRAEEYGFRATNVLHPDPNIELKIRWR